MPDDEGVIFSPETFAEHDAELSYVRRQSRTREPLGRQKRFPRIIAGAWGKLAAGATITAASGLTLGSGTVKLCDREGAVSDDAEDITVANAGGELLGGSEGLLVPLEWTEGEWSVCGCGVGTSFSIWCCSPCHPPQKDLSITFSYYWVKNNEATDTPPTSTHIGDETATLTYASTGENFWEASWSGEIMCPDGVARPVKLECMDLAGFGEPPGTLVFTAGPSTYQAYLTDPGGDYDPWGGYVGGLFVFQEEDISDTNGEITWPVRKSVYECVPIHFKGENWWYNEHSFPSTYAGYFELTDPSPGTYAGACCPVEITVLGCTNEGVAGATYSVWSDDTKEHLLFSGTTGGSGLVAFALYNCGSFYREATHPRFQTMSGYASFFGVQNETFISPAPGYHCFSGCNLPLADTLPFTHTYFGDGELVWVAEDSWLGFINFDYPGCLDSVPECVPTTMLVRIAFSVDGLTVSTFADAAGCPTDVITEDVIEDVPTSQEFTCFPLNAVGHYPAGRGPATVFCVGAPADDTLTVTE